MGKKGERKTNLVSRYERLDVLVLDPDALDLRVVLSRGHDRLEGRDLYRIEVHSHQQPFSRAGQRRSGGEGRERKKRTSCSSTKLQPSPLFPARAVRPTRWTYLRMSAGMSYEMTWETLGRSIPREMTSEAMSLREGEGG